MTIDRVIRRAAFACALFLAGTGAAQAMTVSEFLARVDALKARGMMALFAHSEIAALSHEGEAAANAWRGDLQAAKEAGRTPPACPPAKLKLGQDEFLGMLRAVPPAERGSISVRDQFAREMDKRYPCAG